MSWLSGFVYRSSVTPLRIAAALPIAALLGFVAGSFDGAKARGQEGVRELDPAAWGADHVGKPLPEYITGDECLFCHRDIGPTWLTNRHQLSLRLVTSEDTVFHQLAKLGSAAELLSEANYMIGSKRAVRLLRRSRAYGKLDLSSITFESTAGQRNSVSEPQFRIRNDSPRDSANHPATNHLWDSEAFGDHCAGCHTTAVDTRTGAFSALSLDCFACHGDVPIQHNEDINLALLSSLNQQARDIASICGQCHLRGGKSKTTGRPFANQFVAGDNLFRDFDVDFRSDNIEALPWDDRHIYQNTRDMVVFGDSKLTCLSCHEVHGQGSEKHQSLDHAEICSTCHLPDTDNAMLRDEVGIHRRLQTHSVVCGY